MPITYTNRKGFTFYLRRGVTKTGKPRYFFARDLKGEPVEHIPDGFAISESVNGVVSLVKARPGLIQPHEVAVVETALKRHPKSHDYRVSIKRDQIEVYERVGPDASDLTRILGRDSLDPGMRERIENEIERDSQFTPVLRFVLSDKKERTFGVQRMCYRSSIDGWLDISEDIANTSPHSCSPGSISPMTKVTSVIFVPSKRRTLRSNVAARKN